MISFNPTRKTRYIQIKNRDWKPSIIKSIECPTCGLEKIEKKDNKWIGKCNSCGHIHHFLVPTPVQSLLIQLRSRIINMIGGTGSGKTTASAAIVAETLRVKTGVKGVAFAQSLEQLKSTAKEELAKFFLDSDF